MLMMVKLVFNGDIILNLPNMAHVTIFFAGCGRVVSEFDFESKCRAQVYYIFSEIRLLIIYYFQKSDKLISPAILFN